MARKLRSAGEEETGRFSDVQLLGKVLGSDSAHGERATADGVGILQLGATSNPQRAMRGTAGIGGMINEWLALQDTAGL